MAILLEGLKGAPVKRLQEKLNVKADGIFGNGTEKALTDYQKSKGLKADGIAGPDTFMSLGLIELILLKRGSKGDTVKKLQEKLGAGADGKFGSGTEKAVKDYQTKNSLKADGIAGPETLKHLGLFGITDKVVAASVEGGKNVWDSVTEATEGALNKVKGWFGM